jgi:phosphatidylinositol alpha-1,6-mannosyltransferase
VVLVNSANTSALAQGRGVRGERIRIVHPGTHLPELDDAAADRFRQKFAMTGATLMLSVGRLTRRKGLAEFVEHALPTILTRRPDALLVVIGEEATDALHSHKGSERERILAAARKADVERSIRFLGRCDEADLGAAYQAAQVHVFPVLDEPGDVEGFGMVAVEAAAHGLPTVAFAVGGVPDAIDEPASGTLIASGDYGRFADAVVAWLGNESRPEQAQTCRAFAAGKDWNAFGNQLRSALRNDARV